MKAAVGDRMVVASAKVDGMVRDGEIKAVGADGGPPYLVHWSETGHESLFYPGPDAHVEHLVDAGVAPQPAKRAASEGSPPARTWRVDVYVYEGQDTTTAHAVLHGEGGSPMTSKGKAHLRPGDLNVPEIGDEMAAARALRRLADRLLDSAGQELVKLEGHPSASDPDRPKMQR